MTKKPGAAHALKAENKELRDAISEAIIVLKEVREGVLYLEAENKKLLEDARLQPLTAEEIANAIANACEDERDHLAQAFAVLKILKRNEAGK